MYFRAVQMQAARMARAERASRLCAQLVAHGNSYLRLSDRAAEIRRFGSPARAVRYSVSQSGFQKPDMMTGMVARTSVGPSSRQIREQQPQPSSST